MAYYEEEDKRDVGVILLLIVVLLLVFWLHGCSTQRYITNTDTVYLSKNNTAVTVRIDTAYVDRWHTVTTAGDTVYIRDSMAVYRYVYNTDTMKVTDTLRDVVRDTVYIREKQQRAVLVYVATILCALSLAVGVHFGRFFAKK